VKQSDFFVALGRLFCAGPIRPWPVQARVVPLLFGMGAIETL
jgi:hypothetical protein